MRDYLVNNGISPAAVGTAGFGESRPVASNESATGHQQNRRVEIAVSGDAIERRLRRGSSPPATQPTST